MNIDERIKQLRIDNKLSQKDLAEILKVSSKTISHWENGYTEPPLSVIVKLKKHFDIAYEDLLE